MVHRRPQRVFFACDAVNAGRTIEKAMKSIFLDCNDQLAPVWARVMRPDDPKIDVNRTPFAREELPLVLAGYDIALDDHSYMPTELVARCRQLKHIVFLGTGAASYMNIAELKDRGVNVHTIKGYGDTAVAEHSIALLFACARDIARMDREVRSGIWTPQEGVQLFGKTLGVIGLGGIGREVARIAMGMGMEVIAYNRTPQPQADVPLVDIDTLIARADVVSLHLALGDGTRGFLNAERIARMKPGVILVNTARGALVEEAALMAALQSGHIRHAGLDVFHTEPLKANHPLTKLPNVTLTTHAAFRTLEASMTLLRRAVDIVRGITAKT
jgi:D-3-phosphoglycerate dehydrogenase